MTGTHRHGLTAASALPLRFMAVGALWLSGSVTMAVVLASPLPVYILPAAVLVLAYLFVRLDPEHASAPARSGSSAHPGAEDAGPSDPSLADHFVAKEFAAARRGRDVTLVMFGFSRFDEFTKREGAKAADDAVHEFGRVLQRLTRQMNLSARYGWRADAFLSVLSDANAAAAEGFVARVRAAAASLDLPMPGIEVGVAVYQPHLASPQEFVESAEQALATARRASNDAAPHTGETIDARDRSRVFVV